MCSEYLDISIHALLAESDGAYRGARQSRPHFYPRSPCGERPFRIAFKRPWKHFYPRSPCGERLLEEAQRITGLIFLSTLSLRRATRVSTTSGAPLSHFYPRSPCGERPSTDSVRIFFFQLFLSTLSLRRATPRPWQLADQWRDFYPRSPCGERHCIWILCRLHLYFYPRSPCGERLDCQQSNARNPIFLSTLSLRRATAPCPHCRCR